MKHLIAITGGIGAGKSVVSQILRTMGYSVYDCDSSARSIMDNNPQIKSKLSELITPHAVNTDGTINRRAISEVVFKDSDKLAALNGIVHGAVRRDLQRWGQTVGSDPAFVETAILYQSELDRMVDEVWEVDAPVDVRIDRVCRRNKLTPSEVSARIASQQFIPESPHPLIHQILNDNRHSLLLQIHALLQK